MALSDMEKATRRHLLQAFIRFELRCKVYNPLVWSHLEGTKYADIINKSNEKLSLHDYEELYCVFEHLKGLYGAIFAHCDQDSWFPERSVSKIIVPDDRPRNEEDELLSARDYGLLFPDDLYFDMDIHANEPWLDLLGYEILPCLGLDSLSSILRSPELNNTKGCRIKHWVCGLARQANSSWILNRHFAQHHDLYVTRTRLHQWLERMESWNDLTRPIGYMTDIRPKIDIDQETQQLYIQNLQSAIYRQRAWIFFTDSSDHQPCLPSWDNIAAQQELVSDVLGLEHHRRRRRSQKWQSYWAGQSLDSPFEADASPDQGEEDSGGLNHGDFVLPAIPRFFEKPWRDEMVRSKGQ
jgi:hypothetical protein